MALILESLQCKFNVMLKNYITMALRNLIKHKGFSFINIAGLSIGISCCLLLALYIQDEMSYDKHHTDVNNIYRIITEFHNDKGLDRLQTASPPIALGMRDDLPEVENAARMLNPPGVAENLIKYGSSIFYIPKGYLADASLFDVLTYDFIEGNPKKALVHANSVVITETLSKKLFGTDPALNKLINISQGGPAGDFKVTGVIKENHKSHVNPNFIVSMTSSGWGDYMRSPAAQGEWAGQNFVPSYLRLVPGHNKEEVVKKMNQVLLKYGAEDMKALGFTKTLDLELVKDIYLKSDVGQNPRITYLYVIASIAVFILLIACINFMNLSTAKATSRASEIGVRKVMGAYRSSLIGQILGEAMVLVIISILVSVVMMQMALPFFNQLTGKNISFGTENLLYFGSALAIITLITGLVAGSYPAFYLSSFQPAQVLKGKSALSDTSGWLRQSLVVFQFMIGIILVCGMIIIGKQLDFMENKYLGFESNAKIVLPLRTASAQKNYFTLQQELSRNSSVKQLSAADYMPGSFIWSDFSLYTRGGNMDNAILHRINRVDFGYIELLGLKIIAGRSFTDNREVESNGKVIINRTGAKALGFDPEQAVGQELYSEYQGEKQTYQIIGVLEDYHQVTLKEKINPILLMIKPAGRNYDYAIATLASGKFDETIATIEKTWKSLINDTPFEYSFLDQDIQKQYDEDRKVSKIISSFTIIAMLISCLGLYGLSTYMAERRFKEIGVRKVMGASVNQIVGLMSKEFVRLVIIAIVISVPLALYAMNKWLEGFEYKIQIDALVFVYAGIAALTVALLTVSFESVKAAMGNPVDSLRNE